MPELPIVTIDGPAGVGKSTIASMLAQKLSIPYLDTGAMFRYLALKLGPDGLDLSDEAIKSRCEDWHFSLSGSGADTVLSCCGKPVGKEIRCEDISALASKFAKKAAVREILLKAQRDIGKDTPLVAEGRDMGTVVFPETACKFFLDASPRIRALRRWQQNNKQGNLEELEKQIKERDEQDRTRAIAPLKPAPGACIIDTSHMDVNQVLQTMQDYIHDNCGILAKL